jgi:hypothetical protein
MAAFATLFTTGVRAQSMRANVTLSPYARHKGPNLA